MMGATKMVFDLDDDKPSGVKCGSNIIQINEAGKVEHD